MKHTAIRSALLVATLASAPAMQVNAQIPDEAGRVLFSIGEVSIVTPDGASRPAERGDRVLPGERVVTGPGAMSQVKTTGGGLVGVRPGSDLTFERPAAPGGASPVVLNLGSGNVRIVNVPVAGGAGAVPVPVPVLLKTSDGQVQLTRADVQALVAAPAAAGTSGGEGRTLLKLERGEGIATNTAGDSVAMRPGEPVSVARDRLQTLASDSPGAASVLAGRLDTAQEVLATKPTRDTPIETSTGPKPALSSAATLARGTGASAAQYAGLDLSPNLTGLGPALQVRVEDKLSANATGRVQGLPVNPVVFVFKQDPLRRPTLVTTDSNLTSQADFTRVLNTANVLDTGLTTGASLGNTGVVNKDFVLRLQPVTTAGRVSGDITVPRGSDLLGAGSGGTATAAALSDLATSARSVGGDFKTLVVVPTASVASGGIVKAEIVESPVVPAGGSTTTAVISNLATKPTTSVTGGRTTLSFDSKTLAGTRK